MGPIVSLSVFMRPYGFYWVLMCLYASILDLMGPYASLSVLIRRYVF